MFRGPSGARRPEASRRTEKLRNAIPLDVRSEIPPLCAIVEIRLGAICCLDIKVIVLSFGVVYDALTLWFC